MQHGSSLPLGYGGPAPTERLEKGKIISPGAKKGVEGIYITS